jgi:hypothetical protein
MATFELTRGCVYRVGNYSQGTVIQIEPAITSSNEDSPVLITGVQTNEQDLVLPVMTLDNFGIMYTFGEDFGGFNIIGLALLGSVGGVGDALANVVEWFKENRVTTLQDAISVSLGGGGAYKVFVTGLSIAEADTEFHIQPFIVTGRVAKSP